MPKATLNQDLKFKIVALKSSISINNKCLPNVPNYFSQKLSIGLLIKLKTQQKSFAISPFQNKIAMIQRYKKI